MKHKIKGGFNWKFWEPEPPKDPNKPKVSWYDNFKNLWKTTPTNQPVPTGAINTPAPMAKPMPAQVQAPRPETNSSSISLSPSTTTGGKRKSYRRKKRKTKKKGGNYKSVHHSNTARPTYWLK